MKGARLKDSFLELFEFGRQLAVQTDSRRLFELAVQGACRLTEAHACALWLVEETAPHLTFSSYHTAGTARPPAAAGRWLRRLISRNAPVKFTRAQAQKNGLAKYLAPGPAVLLPLRCGDKVCGALVAHSDNHATLSAEELEWLSLVAGQVELGIWSGEKSERQKRLKENLGAVMSNLGSALSLSGSPHDFLRLVANLALDLSGAQRVFVWIMRNERAVLLSSANRSKSKPLRVGRASALSLVRRALRERAPCGWSEEGSWPAGSALAIPLFGSNGPVGALSLYWKAPRAYGEPERGILLSFAAQVEMALDNMLLQQSDEKRAAQLTDLSGAAGLMAACSDFSALMKTVIEATASALDVPTVALCVLQDDGCLRVAPEGCLGVSKSQAAKFRVRPARNKIADRVVNRQETLAAGANDSAAADKLAGPLKVKQLACAPLLGGEGPLGMLVIGRPKGHAFRPTELILLSAYASQAALALRNMMLCDDFTKHLDHLSTFSEFARTLASSLDLKETLKTVLRSAATLLNCDAGLVMLKDPRAKLLRVEAAHGFSKRTAQTLGRELELEDSLSGLAFSADSILISNDMARDGRCKNRPAMRKLGMVSAMLVPLKARGKPLGVFSVMSKRRRKFSEQDKRLVTILADSAGIAIDNASLYLQEKTRAEDLSGMLQEANHRIRSSLQTAAELLEMESEQEEITTEQALRRSVDRIQVIGAVHGLLSREDFRAVEMKEGARRIADIALRSFARSPAEVCVHVCGAQLLLESKKATALALILNELINNSLQHGLPGKRKGQLSISFTKSPREVHVMVKDDGVGLPQDFHCEKDSKMGLKIAAGLARQDLGGELKICSKEEGTLCQVRFPYVG